METFLFVIYLIMGYWAVGETIYANKIVFSTGYALFIRKLIYSAFLGWILIPVAIIKMLLSR